MPPTTQARARFPFVIRDPLLGDLRLDDAERTVLDSDAFQRQRGVKQLGTSMLIYPSAVQTRFVHALGNLEIIGRMVRAALGNSDPLVRGAFVVRSRGWLRMPNATDAEVETEIVRVARIAGLCHDLGHLPLSHVMEYAIKAAEVESRVLGPDYIGAADLKPHEFATLQLLRKNGATNRGIFANTQSGRRLKRCVVRVIEVAQQDPEERTGNPIAAALAGLISSEVDSDRAEYLRRDNYVSGAGYGQYDIQKIVGSLLLVSEKQAFHIVPSVRALAAVEAFLIDRVRSYQHLYYHPVGVLMDALVSGALQLAFQPAVLAGLAGKRRRIVAAARKKLTPENLNYERLPDPNGYIDDAHLWEYLRTLLRACTEAKPRRGERELRRLHCYLRVLLRREHLWLAIWKREEEFNRISKRSFESFCKALSEHHRMQFDAHELQEVRQQMAQEMGEKRSTTPDVEHLSVLNYLAHLYARRVLSLTDILETLLAKDASLRDLHTDFFVEIGTREFFRPLKNPKAYRLVALDGRTLVPFADVAPASVRSIESLWYEGIQLRAYVVAERELMRGQRDRLRARASVLLPEAVRLWYLDAATGDNPINFFAVREPKV